MGKPTTSTLASLAGLFKEKDERSVSQAPDGQAKVEERLTEAAEPCEKEVTTHRVRVSTIHRLLTIRLVPRIKFE